MKPTHLFLFILVCSLITYQCTTIQGRNNEKKKKALAFLDQFEKSLKGSESVILSHFQVEKSSEAVLKSIHIMQNTDKDKDSVLCEVSFKTAEISFEENSIRIDVPAVHRSFGDSIKIEKEVKLYLWLESNNGELVIKRIEADEFYNGYQNVIHEVANKKMMARSMVSKKIFFDQGLELQNTYDSVIWFTRSKDSTYYYVVNGKWKSPLYGENTPWPESCHMGLVSETGRIVVPPAYDLVGTIGFDSPDVIEVKKDGLVGLFSLSGKELVPAQYDWIIPYATEGVNGIVKQDSLFGWLDHSYSYHKGFPSDEAAKYIKQFGYLSNHLNIDAKSKTMTQMLSPDYIGYGLVMPPSYLVKAGIVRQIVAGINLGDNSVEWGGTEYVRTEESLFENISGKLSAFVVVIKERYLEGRQDFYKRNNVTFVDANDKPLGNFTLGPGSISFKKIDSTLLEIKVVSSADDLEYTMVGYQREWNPTIYSYFKLANGKPVEAVTSKRRFQFTEYVKLDSTYLSGEFVRWDAEQKASVTSQMLSTETIKDIRNEILAVYGYEFDDPKKAGDFGYRDWYVPRYSKYESFLDQMTDIDRHNLEFLERIIGTLRKPAS